MHQAGSFCGTVVADLAIKRQAHSLDHMKYAAYRFSDSGTHANHIYIFDGGSLAPWLQDTIALRIVQIAAEQMRREGLVGCQCKLEFESSRDHRSSAQIGRSNESVGSLKKDCPSRRVVHFQMECPER